MIRMLVRGLLSIIANTVGLFVAALVLDNFSITGFSFVVAVLVFTVATVVLGPLIVKIAHENAPYLEGGIALVTTFVGLFLTNLLTSGISIDGLGTWIAATLIIWLAAIVASLILPLLLFKKILNEHKTNQ